MKKLFVSIVLLSLLLSSGASCKKAENRPEEDSTQSKKEVAADSTFMLSVNGTTMTASDDILRDADANRYMWQGGDSTFYWTIRMQFSGTDIDKTSYLIDSLHTSPAQGHCRFYLICGPKSNPNNGGQAGSGVRPYLPKNRGDTSACFAA